MATATLYWFLFHIQYGYLPHRYRIDHIIHTMIQCTLLVLLVAVGLMWTWSLSRNCAFLPQWDPTPDPDPQHCAQGGFLHQKSLINFQITQPGSSPVTSLYQQRRKIFMYHTVPIEAANLYRYQQRRQINYKKTLFL